MFRQIILTVTFAYMLVTGAVFAEEIDHEKIYAAGECTVVIEGDKVDNKLPRNGAVSSYNGVGAGFIIDSRGYIITNYHVIDGIHNIQVKTSDGTKYQAQLINHDPVTDIALIKIAPIKSLSTILIGYSNSVHLLDRVVAIGNPFGYSFSMTCGEISGLNREVMVTNDLKYANMIQTSAAINPGNSGGPLLNAKGEVIGINSALRLDSICIAFAIPIDLVVEVAARLVAQHTSQYCYHGIRFHQEDVDQLGKNTNQTVDYGALLKIESIDPNSPAKEAGMQVGDRVVSINGVSVMRKLDFQRTLLELRENDIVEIIFERDNEKYDVAFALRNPRGAKHIHVASQASAGAQQRISPQIAQSALPINNNFSNKKNNFFGIESIAIAKNEIRRYVSSDFPYYNHKVSNAEGAIRIVSVEPNSIMSNANIVADDLILAVIHKETNDVFNITNLNDLNELISIWSPEYLGSTVSFIVVRDQKIYETTVDVQTNIVSTKR